MRKLIKEQPATSIFHRKQLWMIGNYHEVLVSYGKNKCAININLVVDKNHFDITKQIAESIYQKHGYKYSISTGIDCFFIDCLENQVEEILSFIEEISQ